LLRDLLGRLFPDALPVPKPMPQRLRPPLREALGRGQALSAQFAHPPPCPADRDDGARRFRPHDRRERRCRREPGFTEGLAQARQLDGGLAGVGILHVPGRFGIVFCSTLFIVENALFRSGGS
jgi:hypothetical protein